MYFSEEALKARIEEEILKRDKEALINSEKTMDLANAIRVLIKDSPKSIVNKAIHIAKCSLNWD